MFLLISHILIALIGIGTATISIQSPTKRIILATYWATIGTVTSGLLLVAMQPQALLKTCLLGICYSTATLSLSFAAQKRLNQSNQEIS